jgi:hypothetical protein
VREAGTNNTFIYENGKFYGWDTVCPHKRLVKTLFPAGDAVLGGSGNFRRWCLVRGSRSQGCVLEGCVLSRAFLYLFLCLLSTMMSHFAPPLFSTMILCFSTHRHKSNGALDGNLGSCKPKYILLSVVLLRYFAIVTKSDKQSHILNKKDKMQKYAGSSL